MIVALTGIAVVLVAAAVSAAGFILISKHVPDRWVVADADAASALYASISMVYAILIAIAAIAVWEPYTDARESTSREASDLTEIGHLSSGLPDPGRAEIRRLSARYVNEVITVEWPRLRDEHTESPQAAASFQQLRNVIEGFTPGTEREDSLHDQLLSRISNAADARHTRLVAADNAMPALLWPVLAVGGLVSILFLYLFGLDRTFPNGMMMATVGGMIGLVLFVIFQIEYPYSGGMAVDVEPFRHALSQFSTS